jgi:hypothetical protein
MRTRTSIGVVGCALCMSFVASDAGARWLAPGQVPDTVSAAGPQGLPSNITISSTLEDVVARMLRASPTFRTQCRLIGRLPHVRVQITLDALPSRAPARTARAQCRLGRHQYGGVTAAVHVWSREDAIELVAHELEHVIEATEGTNYRAMARIQPGAVWSDPAGAYETARAIEAGLQVKRETRGAAGSLAKRLPRAAGM